MYLSSGKGMEVVAHVSMAFGMGSDPDPRKAFDAAVRAAFKQASSQGVNGFINRAYRIDRTAEGYRVMYAGETVVVAPKPFNRPTLSAG